MIDIIFLSYDEANADANYQRLLDRFPYAKRVHGMEGIKNAHIAASKKAMTSTFYVVDGDNVVADDFLFDYKPPEYDQKYVHIYQSLNPVTLDVYGYGGIKIFHKSMFKNLDGDMPIDFSTSIGDGVKYIDQIASTTHFNSSPFHAWRGAYRELSKLQYQSDKESVRRIGKWRHVNAYQNVPFVEYVREGVYMAYEDYYGDINRINDYEWLAMRFKDVKDDIV
jgi:hypothetical protein